MNLLNILPPESHYDPSLSLEENIVRGGASYTATSHPLFDQEGSRVYGWSLYRDPENEPIGVYRDGFAPEVCSFDNWLKLFDREVDLHNGLWAAIWRCKHYRTAILRYEGFDISRKDTTYEAYVTIAMPTSGLYSSLLKISISLLYYNPKSGFNVVFPGIRTSARPPKSILPLRSRLARCSRDAERLFMDLDTRWMRPIDLASTCSFLYRKSSNVFPHDLRGKSFTLYERVIELLDKEGRAFPIDVHEPIHSASILNIVDKMLVLFYNRAEPWRLLKYPIPKTKLGRTLFGYNIRSSSKAYNILRRFL